jgi:hypothetical protein
MSFDLVVVGGTGQWLLLELCLRLERSPHPKEFAEFPENVWLVDRDLGPLNQPGADASKEHLGAVLQGRLQEANRRRQADNHYSLSRIACQPAMGRESNLGALLLDPKETDIAWVATTQLERNTDVRQGFYALPRLSAIWTSIQGFQGQPPAVVGGVPSFLLPSSLAPAGPAARPIVVVGSLAGGTGAGLLPYLYQRLRDAPVAAWRRPVVIVAVLPWFMPPAEGGGQFQTISWTRCCRNACSGVKALYRISADLRRRALEAGEQQLPAELPPTTCVLTGPGIEEAKAAAVERIDPSGACQRGFIAPIIQMLADALPGLVDQGRPQDQRQRFGFGTLQARFLRVASASRSPATSELVSLHAAGTYWSALRAQAVAAMDLEHAAHLSRHGALALGGVQQVSGLRRSLGPMVLSAVLARRELTLAFLQSFTARLSRRAGDLRAVLDPRVSASAAGHLPAIFEELDNTFEDEERRLLWQHADVKDGATERRGTLAADLVFAALLRASDRAGSTRDLRSGGHTVEVRRLLPLHPDQTDQGAEGVSFHSLPGAFESAAEVEALAELYAREGELGVEECDSRSYATFLSTAHVAADLTATLRPGHPPDDQHSLRHAIPLWRGFLHGLLELADTPPPRRGQIELTEGSLDAPRAFGPRFETIVIRLPQAATGRPVALGIVSAALGLVPHTDLLETPTPPDKLDAAFKELARRLAEVEPDETSDFRVLAAFARHYLPGPRGSVPAWYRLLTSLCPAYPRPEEVASWLYARTLPGRSVPLQLAPDGMPVEAYVPLRLDRSAVAGILAAEREDLFLTSPAGIDFQPFAGGDQMPLLRFARTNGGARRIVWRDAAAVAKAATAVPAAPGGFNDSVLDWPVAPAGGRQSGLEQEGSDEQVP